MSNVIFSVGNFNIYWYSILILIGIIIGIYLAVIETRRIGASSSFITDYCFYTIPIGIIGGRLYYVIFNFDLYKDNLIDIFKVWEGGMAIYGVIIASIVFLILYAKKRERPIINTMDILVPSLILGQAIGRWGNFFNKEAFGPETTLSFLKSLHLPNFIIEGMKINGIYHEPTFLYESLWCLVGFIILILLRYLYKNMNNGLLTSIYFIWYAVGRFYIEALRQDSLYISNYKVSQIVSVILIITGVIGIIISFMKQEKYNHTEEMRV